jgi:hypothetical protein
MKILKFLVFFSLFSAFSFLANAQKLATNNTKEPDWWVTLFKVKYENWQTNFEPRYTTEIKALDGKKITIKGFLIPLQEQKKHSYFLLSAFPFDQCFYCGKAGPETVIEITVKKPIKTTDKIIIIRGTLQINYQDPSHLFYIIDDGEQVE